MSETISQPKSHLDRAKGMLGGLAIGDAMGMSVEFSQMGEFTEVTGYRAGGPFDLPSGYWTDDTSMALCLADSLIAEGGYNSYDVMDRYVRWRDDGYRSSINYCFDIGNQTSAALSEFRQQKELKVAADKPRGDSAGNGTIMRLAPVVIASFEGRGSQEILEMARVSARETHYAYEAEAGTEVFAAMLIKAVTRDDKTEVTAVHDMSTGEHYDQVLAQILPGSYTDLSNSGYIIHSLQVAVWGFLNSENFEEGLLKVVNLGGDSDTNGAIYGQLAGAYYGYDNIPEELKRGLFQEKEIAELAEQLYNLPKPFGIIETRFAEDDL